MKKPKGDFEPNIGDIIYYGYTQEERNYCVIGEIEKKDGLITLWGFWCETKTQAIEMYKNRKHEIPLINKDDSFYGFMCLNDVYLEEKLQITNWEAELK